LKHAAAGERGHLIARAATIVLPLLAEAADSLQPQDQLAVKAFERVSLLAAHLADQDYAAAILDLAQSDTLLWGGSNRIVPPQLTRTLSLAADLALAQDVDAMRSAIENSLTPADRYLAKRIDGPARRVFFVNAYVGAVAGLEKTRGDPSNTYARAVGAALPVGVEVNFSRRVGVFAQVFDLGQVLNYRLGDTTTRAAGDTTVHVFTQSAPPGLTVQTVFSPGGLLVLRPWGFFLQRPYALIAGVSYSPQLRERRIGSADFSRAGATRFSIGLVVDVPIAP
jgi:hypothetical protein